MNDIHDTIRWNISVPIFKNTVIMKQLMLAIGIPFGLVVLIIALTSGRSRDTLYALGLIAALLLLTWLFILVVYRGRYEVEFVLDQKGVLCRTQERQARKNRIVNTLTVLAGVLTGKPAVSGAGLLASSRQETLLRWNHITKVSFKPKRGVILLRGGWTEQIALFCTDQNYALVEYYVKKKTQPVKEVRRK